MVSSLMTLACTSILVAATPPINVLFIGNSYTHMNNMPKLFEKIATSNKQNINVEMSAKSNHTFKMHCDRPEMFEKISSKKWDYIVIQGFSRELINDYDYIDTACIPYFNRIVDSIYRSNPCTNILLYETWGYKNGLNDSTHNMSYETMSDRVEMGYKYLSEMYNLPIVPVGRVWQQINTKYDEIELYAEDDSHPTITGSYLTACSFFSAIFKKLPEGDAPSEIDIRNAKILQDAAYNFILTNVDVYNLKLNSMFVSFETAQKGHFVIKGKSYFPNADSLIWDFGDDIKATAKNVIHRYAKEGSYQIMLTVFDNCGERNLFRVITFIAPVNSNKKKTPKKPIKSSSSKQN